MTLEEIDKLKSENKQLRKERDACKRRCELEETFISSLIAPYSEDYQRLWEPHKTFYDNWRSEVRRQEGKK